MPEGVPTLVCSVNSEGRLLAFPLEELPEMEKGRGNLLFGVPGKQARAGKELMVSVALVPQDGKLLVSCGERRMTVGWKDLDGYRGSRGQRGALLPRGWRKVDRIEADR